MLPSRPCRAPPSATRGTTSLAEQRVTQPIRIAKADDARQTVFGWAMVAVKKSGETVVDAHDHWITVDDLEETAYNFMLDFVPQGAASGEDHDDSYRPDGFVIESVMFTPEKIEAMGMEPGSVDLGHWVGLYIPDKDAYERVKSGEKAMLSVEGDALETNERPTGQVVYA